MRKSPVRHQVHTYRRDDGKVVHNYLRGHGSYCAGYIANPTIKAVKPEGFSVFFNYEGNEPNMEEQQVIATSYIHALQKAFENKTDPRNPVEIIVKDPSLKEIFHSAGEHAKSIAQSAAKYGKIAGQKAFEEGKVLGKKALEASAESAGHLVGDVRAAGLQQIAKRNDFWGGMAQARLNRLQSGAADKYLERLVKESYSTNPVIKRKAQIQLREKYPSVYREMELETTRAPQRQHITLTTTTKMPSSLTKKDKEDIVKAVSERTLGNLDGVAKEVAQDIMNESKRKQQERLDELKKLRGSEGA